jgi:hypothetical protein
VTTISERSKLSVGLILLLAGAAGGILTITGSAIWWASAMTERVQAKDEHDKRQDQLLEQLAKTQEILGRVQERTTTLLEARLGRIDGRNRTGHQD